MAIAIVTGGNSGIGRAAAVALAARNFDVGGSSARHPARVLMATAGILPAEIQTR
jgi:NAD(P)-dependent dehydrogenase (short-subunit alcohol dehydrogenase family)